jgi:hypothetical protein
LSLGGKSELSISYNMSNDSVNGAFKQSLSGSVTIGLTGGIQSAVSRLPSILRDPVQAKLGAALASVSMSDVTEASVSFELASNVDNLATLAASIDAELSKGNGASAAGIWSAVSSFVKNPANCYTSYSASLSLTEKVLGVKAGVKTPEQVSAGGEASLSRGQEIKLAEGSTKPK